MGNPEKQSDRIAQISEQREPLEFGLVNEYATERGLKRNTALKLYLRETLPSVIAELKGKVNG